MVNFTSKRMPFGVKCDTMNFYIMEYVNGKQRNVVGGKVSATQN